MAATRRRRATLAVCLLLAAHSRCITLELERLCAGSAQREPSLFHMGSCYVAVLQAADYRTHMDSTCRERSEKYIGHLVCPFRPGLADLLYSSILPANGQIWTCLAKPDAAAAGTYAYYYNTSTKMFDVDLPWTLFQWHSGFGALPDHPATVIYPSLAPMVDYHSGLTRQAVCEFRLPTGGTAGGPLATRRFRRAAAGYRTDARLTIATGAEKHVLDCVRRCAGEPLCHCASYSETTGQCHLAIVHCSANGAVQPDHTDSTNAVYEEEPYEY